MKKKGISPLIATVLLIGFTVALAAVIMTWGLEYIKGTTEDVNRQTDKFTLCVTKLKLEVQFDCPNNKIIVENNGEVDVDRVRIAIQKATPVAIEGGGIPSLLSTEYQADLSGATEIKVQPQIRGRDNVTVIKCDALEYPVVC